jgi:MoxR-like ATPase
MRILLVDEIDEISHAFEAQLLEFLGEWQLTIPGSRQSLGNEWQHDGLMVVPDFFQVLGQHDSQILAGC